ncbi:Coiled-coil domain-containing protein 47 [Kappamyces sp. JEL0829]|nr:Coiled-coil domain-containing protein 47 [Kappamyces sp. JEL0829]
MSWALRTILHFLVVLFSPIAAEAAEYFEDEDVPKPVETPTLKEVDINMLPLRDWKTAKPSDFILEALILLGLASYVLFYVIGNAKNKELARAWLKDHLPVWKENFSHVGDDSGHKMVRDGPKDYIIYGSGRLYVKNVYGFLSFFPRHDLVVQAYNLFMGVTVSDRVQINFVLNEDESDPAVVAIVPRAKATAMTKQRWDLDNFPRPRELAAFPKDDYVLLTDNAEFAANLWAIPSVKKAVWGSFGLDENGEGTRLSKPRLESIMLSDMPFKEPETVEELKTANKTLQFVFSIPDLTKATKEEHEYQTLLSEMMMDVVDFIGTKGRLSSDARSKSLKLRDQAQAVILKKDEERRKKELADKKYAEKIAKEKAIINLSPQAQRKAEEKLRKEEAKKLAQKRTKRI